MLESLRAKVTINEESKDLDEIRIRKIISSLQTYELSLPSQRKIKSLTLKTIDERMEAQDSSDEDEVEKEVAYLAKNFRKFLTFKRDGKSFEKGKFSNFKKDKKDFKKKDSKDSPPPPSSQMVMCFEFKGHEHVKKECPTYLKAKGKVFATTLTDLDSSKSDSKESCDGEGNYSTFMTIALVDSSEDLNALVEEFDKHTEVELMGVGEESNDEGEECILKGTKGLQEMYNSLLEKIGEYVRVAKAAIGKMKRVEQDYKSLLVRYKETKCEVETLNGELTESYSKIKFLELEVI